VLRMMPAVFGWRMHELGEPMSVMRWEEMPGPNPGRGQLVVEVAAVGCNFADLLRCRGGYQVKPELPFTPGAEFVGTVSAVGPEVEIPVGTRVAVVQTIGGLAERAITTPDRVHVLPEKMDFETGAALYVTYRTGHVALFRRARLCEGQTLLVHAGAGGVGSAAIQLGKARGAYVIATAGGPEKVQVCLEQGADVAVDYRTDDFVAAVNDATDGRGANVIYDPVGGDVFDGSRRCVAFEGRIVVIGFTSGRIPELPVNHALVKNYDVIGFNIGTYASTDPELMEAVHSELDALHSQGWLTPLIGEVVPFAEAPAAIAALGDRSTVGKIVCVP
jgi:NADPH:quinone reductase